jgi:phosphohistidine phosphatase SixA
MRKWMLTVMIGVGLATHIAPVSAQKPAKTVEAPAAKTSASEMMDAGQLVPLLQKGGYILIMRHERTEIPSRDDDYSKPATDCMAQRNLSVAGYAGAVETGKALAALNIPIGKVLASPMCRGMDTARMAFGKVEPEMRLIHHDNIAGRTPEISGAEMRALINDLMPGESNIVLVSHIGNINRAINTTPSEGQISIVKREAGGKITVLGMVMGSDFAPYARRALSKK